MHPDLLSAPYEAIVTDPSALAAKLPVEPGRVRSRRLYRDGGTTVMGVAMDAGAVMREHVAPVPILIQVAEGEAVLEVSGRRVALVPGCLIQVAAGVPHEVEALVVTRFLLVLLGAPAA